VGRARPEIDPVELRLRPGGREPEVSVYVTGMPSGSVATSCEVVSPDAYRFADVRVPSDMLVVTQTGGTFGVVSSAQ
jgi:hypothetical protein